MYSFLVKLHFNILEGEIGEFRWSNTRSDWSICQATSIENENFQWSWSSSIEIFISIEMTNNATYSAVIAAVMAAAVVATLDQRSFRNTATRLYNIRTETWTIVSNNPSYEGWFMLNFRCSKETFLNSWWVWRPSY